MTIALVNGRVLTDNGFQGGFAVLIDGDRITGLALPSDPRVRAAERHDLGGRTLLPGFIDCQVNGGGGVLFNDAPTVDTIRTIGEAHAKFGTTGFLPTLISDDADVMAKAIDAVNAAVEQGVPGVLGIHLEGPFIAPERKGVHDPAKFRIAGAEDIAMVARRHGGVTLLTLAPERASPEVLAQLVGNGVIVAAGHTAADYETTRNALATGVRGFTHLFNAMTPFTSREPGVVGAALEDAGSWCGLIVDGHHVHPASLRVAIAAKAREKMMLVTDAMPPVGSDNPNFVLKGETITVRDGVCQTADGTLAGSALDMATALRNTVNMVGVPYDEAARMASTYPAAFLGLATTHGHIAAGYRADFVVLDDTQHVAETWIGGVRVHTA
ncbi:N-acetylglucosamine-6-phosphate deacetylase [Luteibacter sp. UNCMF331Sha3.1]|uniref:N-acetylglucosamine-6-phosphate deacetylase n=1 Tax=Luteibacter sp. UNCMF331Sha3.1 TaxID=1502760 RepID=UPI0008D31376|nr:N-acetylglucosamine-6-phosphate deacetylase [Luteibacter sp. UNCMF331Sha3.1]SEM57722.1 N-acetylglucosamine-6-phosphate deacetylase [Luteibacter sp. UNCMF331Sha3.1]